MTDSDPGTFGPGHHLDAARLADAAGDRDAARDALRAAVRLADEREQDDPALLPALVRLGELEAELGDPVDAEACLTRALALAERRLGVEHPDLVVLLNDLSRLLLRRGAHAPAEPLLQRLYALKCATKGEEHPESATVLASLATVRQALGSHEAAEQLWRRVLDIRERTLAPNHVATATALERLAESCAARGRPDEGVRLLQRALAMREITLEAGHPSLRALRERIADLRLQGSADDFGDDGHPVGPSARTSRATPAVPLPPHVPAGPAAGSYQAPPVASPWRMPQPGARSTPAAMAAPRVLPGPEPARSAAGTQAAPAAAAPPTFGLNGPSALVRAGGEFGPMVPAGESRPPTALVMPGAADGLSLQQLLAEIDDAAAAEALQTPVARALAFIRERRVPVLVGGVALLLAGVAAVLPGRGAASEHPYDTTSAASLGLASAGAGAPGAPGPTGLESAADRADLPAATPAGLDDSLRASRRDSLRASYTSEGVVARPTGGDAIPAAVATAGVARGGSDRTATESGDRAGGRESARSAAAPTRSSSSSAASRASAPAIPAPPTGLMASLGARLDSVAKAATARTAPDPMTARLARAAQPTLGGATSAASRPTGTQPARLIGAVPVARYPQTLRASGVQGQVRVTFEVDTLGRPDMRTLNVLHTDHELFTMAVRTVIPEMRFVPAETDGRRVRWLVRMPFEFSVAR